MRRNFRILAANVGDLERQIHESHAKFDGKFMHGFGHEGRKNGRCRTAVPPRDHLAVLVEAGFDSLRRNGVKEVVAEIVLTGPLHPDRCTDRFREQCRLQHEVAFRFTAEAAAQQRDVDGDILDGDVERLRQIFAGAAGALYGSPDLDLAVGEIGRRHRRLHARVGQMRQIIFAGDDLVGALECRFDIAIVTNNEAGLARRFLEFGAVGLGVVGRIGPVVPDDLQGIASLDGRTGITGDHGDAAERLEFRRPGPALRLDHLLDA